MMMGVAQVIGIKPTLRSFFSSEPFSCAIASSAPKGINEEMAAQAVEGQGRAAEAQSFAREVLARDPTYPGAQALLERLGPSLPGGTGTPAP